MTRADGQRRYASALGPRLRGVAHPAIPLPFPMPPITVSAEPSLLQTGFWHLLTTKRDYAYTMPTATAKKLRGVKLKPGGPRQPLNRQQRRQAQRATAEHAQVAYERTVTDWHHQQRQRANTTA